MKTESRACCRRWALVCATGLAAGFAAGSGGDQALNLIPWPKSVQREDGTLRLTRASRIVAADTALEPLGHVLAGEIAMLTGIRIPVAGGDARAGDILLQFDRSCPGESHILRTDTKVTISGGAYRSVAQGTISLLQLIRAEGGAFSVPVVTIRDEPESTYRGLMLDVARQPHSIPTLEQCIELCRLYKINYLQLHLMDTESWVFPSKTFPKLTTSNWSGIRAFTLEELTGLVRFADERGVTLVPELETPGHAGAALRTMPEVFGAVDPATGKAIGIGCMNMTSDKLYDALDVLIGEMCDVFKSSPYFHIGCDEVWLGAFHKTPGLETYLTAHGLENSHELYLHFIGRMNTLVRKRGRQTIVWEGFHGDGSANVKIPTDIIVMPFENTYNPAPRLAAHGYTMINTAWCPLYVVNASKQTPEQIYGWNKYTFGTGRQFSRARWYTLDPTPLVIGAQMCSWEQPDWRELSSLRSRLAPMSEQVWNATAQRSWVDFQQRFRSTDALLSKLIRPVSVRVEGLLDPTVKPVDYEEAPSSFPRGFDPALFEGDLVVTLVPARPLREGEEIRYTTNGSAPTASSPLYTIPFAVKGSSLKKQYVVNYPHKAEVVIKAAVFAAGEPVGYAAREAYRYHWIGKEPKRYTCDVYLLPSDLKTLPADVSSLRRVYSGREPWTHLRGLPHVRLPARGAIVWQGVLDVPSAAEYEFDYNSFKGTGRIAIDGKIVLDRLQTDWSRTVTTVHLTKGTHAFVLSFCGEGDAMSCKVRRRASADSEWEKVDLSGDLMKTIRP